MIDLGVLPGSTRSFANDINDRGQVVGSSGNFSGVNAFVWDAASGMADLNALIDPLAGWTLFHATAINDLGQIVGYGF